MLAKNQWRRTCIMNDRRKDNRELREWVRGDAIGMAGEILDAQRLLYPAQSLLVGLVGISDSFHHLDNGSSYMSLLWRGGFK